jgi:tetratricopeptide (TPR) repeat protein
MIPPGAPTSGPLLWQTAGQGPTDRISVGRGRHVIWLPTVITGAAIALLLGGCKTTTSDVSIKDIYGSTGRHAKNIVEQARRETKGDPEVGLDEYNAARKLYDEKEYAKARKDFHKIVKKYKKKHEPVVDDALFYRAECDFQLGHYPEAQDGYDELIKNDQSTKYMDTAVKRLYRIARYWLNSPKPVSEVELATFTSEDGEERLKQQPDAHIPFEFRLRPNVTDRTRPLFDTPGRAVQALRSVHLHDVSGPLADDALMTLATYYFRKGNYRDADLYFSQIRQLDRKSEFEQAAYVLGAHSSYKSYQGALYDSKQLEEAQKLTKSALRFADLPQRPKLEGDLKRMDAELIEREWKRVQYYLGRREKSSAALHCEYLLETYPDSPQAAKAREALIKLGPEHAAGILSTPLFPKEPAKPGRPAEAEEDETEEPARLRLSDEGKSAAEDK